MPVAGKKPKLEPILRTMDDQCAKKPARIPASIIMDMKLSSMTNVWDDEQCSYREESAEKLDYEMKVAAT